MRKHGSWRVLKLKKQRRAELRPGRSLAASKAACKRPRRHRRLSYNYDGW